MIWLLGVVLLFNLAIVVALIYGWGYFRVRLNRVDQAISRIPMYFPPVPDCKFELIQERPCLYSPGSEREKICALREQEAKDKDEKTYIREAPRWIEK